MPLFFTNIKLQNTDITSTAINDTVNLFNNITTGALNIGNGLIGGSISMGTAITGGNINIGTALQGGAVNIGNATTPTGTNGGTVNLGTGSKSTITIGNATDASTNDSRGCCKIRKLQIGSGQGLREMRFGTSSSGAVSFSPSFPTGIIPVVWVGGLQSALTNQVFSIQISNITNVGFAVVRTYIRFSGTTITASGTAGETYSWVAWSS